ncbi:hypothetical protein [Mesorhizobium sp. M0037]|uniref:hypothetical protein n=1 Tax=unclassified Mesorhizobium TaxID=325217 RepID=UPI00333B8AD5
MTKALVIRKVPSALRLARASGSAHCAETAPQVSQSIADETGSALDVFVSAQILNLPMDLQRGDRHRLHFIFISHKLGS